MVSTACIIAFAEASAETSAEASFVAGTRDTTITMSVVSGGFAGSTSSLGTRTRISTVAVGQRCTANLSVTAA